MSMILNIETSTEVCSICLSENGNVLALAESKEAQVHAARITVFIEQVLKDAGKKMEEISAVAVSSGPGSYTGLRIGTSAAKGICYALGKPLISVSTLQALAKASQEESGDKDSIYCPMIDARRMEVYTSAYNDKNEELEGPKALIVDGQGFSAYLETGRQVVFSGNAVTKISEVLKHPKAIYTKVRCSARNLVQLSHSKFISKQFEDLAYYEPLYLKGVNITISKKKL